jgi:protein Tex
MNGWIALSLAAKNRRMTAKLIAQRLNITLKYVESTLSLLEEGATIPFIARYRKEVTGSLDEVEIAEIQREFKQITELEKRRESILKSIEEQGKLTDDLRQRILQVFDINELEDLYLPYKRKRKTRASMARERGLEPLATQLFEQRLQSPESAAAPFLSDEVPTVEDALQGARDIIAEWINEHERARQITRHAYSRDAVIYSKVARGKEQEGDKYRDYFDWSEPLKKCPSHRMLAMRRGEEEGVLRIIIAPDEAVLLEKLERQFITGSGPASAQVNMALKDSYERLLGPSIETEFRQLYKEKADKEAIDVFAVNLRQLLLAPPLGEHHIMGIDPGFRTGCKVVCLDASGNLLYNDTIYPHPPQSDYYMASKTVETLVERYQVEAISVGNGTAGRETMDFLRSISFSRPVQLFMVNEAGASIYSASEAGREEFPNHDLTVRGAVSIARRLMDPLAELVKIDPKSIGVGQYQHDVNQPLLKESLYQVVESCVNSVGININTASKHLLTHVSGLGPVLAQNIVNYRAENGPFRSRKSLLKVPRLGDKAFEQSAGFLRIRDAEHLLDNTAVHPESYHIVLQMAHDLNCSVESLIQDAELRKKIDIRKYVSDTVGLPTLKDILNELAKPGLDPRGQARAFEFDRSIKSIEDLRIGMVLPGIINNITNFGAFVDIGIKNSGLVHVSQLADKFVKNPLEVVSLNQEVMARVIDVDLQRGRVQLSLKSS